MCHDAGTVIFRHENGWFPVLRSILCGRRGKEMRVVGRVIRRGLCLVVAAPSGAGKSTLLRGLRAVEPDLVMSVSVTTRAPRAGEAEGVDYRFTSMPEFQRMVAGGQLLEHATVFGRGYGTPREAVEGSLAAGVDVALDIDWQGWRQVRAALPDDTVGVFVLPPSLAELECRLRGRGSDSPDEVARRMSAARAEISHWDEFDHVVVNEDLSASVAEVRGILGAARTSVRRNLPAARLAKELLG